MLTWLKKFGQIVASGLGILGQFAPIIEQVVPKATGTVQVVSKDLSDLLNVVTNAEVFGTLAGLTGAQKATIAGPAIAQIFLSSASFAGLAIANPAALQQAAVTVAGGLADALNAVSAHSLQPAPVPIGPAPTPVAVAVTAAATAA